MRLRMSHTLSRGHSKPRAHLLPAQACTSARPEPRSGPTPAIVAATAGAQTRLAERARDCGAGHPHPSTARDEPVHEDPLRLARPGSAILVADNPARVTSLAIELTAMTTLLIKQAASMRFVQLIRKRRSRADLLSLLSTQKKDISDTLQIEF